MKKAIVVVLLLSMIPILLGVAGVSYVGYQVFYGDTSHLKREKIVEILSKETTVYYSDSTSQLGSLFGQEHRQYIPYRDMPKALLDAVVAAEDDSFYRHFGIDLKSTIRAVYKNIFMRKHEGASTITQQTVKNLYGRQKVNLIVKLQEAINSFKMERLYSKQEILEFYLNQFHVAGNGRGVGIAAKYFFDKEIGELTVNESAFIAGSLKAPYKYTPFTKKTLEAQTKAKAEAKARKNYVLRRMYELKFITKEVYDKEKDAEVPFKQGKFQFNEISAIDIVQRQLTKPEILAAIGVDNADEIGTMGLRITTTINKAVQTAAQYGVRQNLSRLEMILSGFQKESADKFVNVQVPEKYGFYVAQIKDVVSTPKSESVKLSLGIYECTVPTPGIDRVSTFLDRSTYKGLVKAKADFINSIHAGEYVLASVKDIDANNQNIICDIERHPRIQGGLIVLDKGKVLAMVSGYASYEYNRAVLAKRQPGSTFKTLTFYPAMQLGWNVLDKLLNVRTVHQWQGQYYFPRPDHPPTATETTFAGAGSKSENLASVWLLHHLTDKLSYNQFLELLSSMGYYEDGETGEQVLAKIGRKFNVKIMPDNLKSSAFENAKADILDDLSLSSHAQLKTNIAAMNYGAGFDSQAALSAATSKSLSAKEKDIRLNLLKNNFLRWSRLAAEASSDFARLKQFIDDGTAIPDDFKRSLSRFRISPDKTVVSYMSDTPFLPESSSPLLKNPQFLATSQDEILKELDLNRTLLNEENIRLDGVIPIGNIKNIKSEMETTYEQIQNMPTLEKLFWHDDFKYSLGMMYAQKMCKEMGFESEIEWVPSYPLGSSVVTLAELALAYQSVLTGQTWRYFDAGSENQLLLIERIEDWNGQLLWEASPKPYQLVNEFYSGPMMSVLRGTVTMGTAYAAHNSIILSSNKPEVDTELAKAKIRVPSFGKTGTTNDYTNATYVGFLPYPEMKGSSKLTQENAYTIATYVGYDTNESMTRRGLRIAGGTGALPAWIEVAKSLIKEMNYAEKLSWKDLVAKKVQDVPFLYMGDNQMVYAGVHSSQPLETQTSTGDSSPDDEDSNANTYSDYSVNKNGLLALAIPGKFVNNVYSPRRKVDFFKPRSKALETSKTQSETIEPEQQLDLDDSGKKGKPTIPVLPEEKFDDPEDEIPPAPKM